MASERSTSRSSSAHCSSVSDPTRTRRRSRVAGPPRALPQSVRQLLHGMEDQLDLLAGLLLERSDDLPQRRVLLRVVALVPPHDEVGGPGAERRHDAAPPRGRRHGPRINNLLKIEVVGVGRPPSPTRQRPPSLVAGAGRGAAIPSRARCAGRIRMTVLAATQHQPRGCAARSRGALHRRQPEEPARHSDAARHLPGGNTRSILFYPPFPVTMVRRRGRAPVRPRRPRLYGLPRRIHGRPLRPLRPGNPGRDRARRWTSGITLGGAQPVRGRARPS